MKHASIFAEAGHLKEADILSSPAATYMLQNFFLLFFFFTVNNQIILNVLPSERHIKIFLISFLLGLQ